MKTNENVVKFDDFHKNVCLEVLRNNMFNFTQIVIKTKKTTAEKIEKMARSQRKIDALYENVPTISNFIISTFSYCYLQTFNKKSFG